MAYVQIGDEWFWDDAGEQVPTEDPTVPTDGGSGTTGTDGSGSTDYLGGGSGSMGSPGGYDPAVIQALILDTGALSTDSALYDMVKSYQSTYTNQGSAKTVEAGAKSDDSFFGKLKSGLSSAYDKDPLRFLQFGLQGLASAYAASQARGIAKTRAEGDLNVVNQKHANDKEMQERYTNSLRGMGAGRTRQPQKRLTRVGGAPIFDPSGNYIRS